MADFKKMMAERNKVPAREQISNVPENREYVKNPEEKIIVDVVPDNTVPMPEPIKEFKEQKTPKEKTAKAKIESEERTLSVRHAVMLTSENNRYLRMKAKQSRVTIEVYLQQILDRAIKEKYKMKHGESLFDECFRKYSSKKERSTAALYMDQWGHIEKETTDAGISYTDYFNYVVEWDRLQG